MRHTGLSMALKLRVFLLVCMSVLLWGGPAGTAIPGEGRHSVAGTVLWNETSGLGPDGRPRRAGVQEAGEVSMEVEGRGSPSIVPAGGSMIARIAASSTIVISQIYGGGGNAGAPYQNDYVEIFNRGVAPVSLVGWSVQYTSPAGSTWQVTPLSGTIVPGQYYLVQEAAGAGCSGSPCGSPLPQPDASPASKIAMSSTSGKIALVDTTTPLNGSCPTGSGIVDFVGYGSNSNCFEGSSPTSTLSSSTSAMRGEEGCADNDQNSSDLSPGPPVPRNSFASLHPCEVSCAISCSPDITRSNDPEQCGAVVVFSSPATIGNCVQVECTPSSGTFFPVGVSTVSCSASSGSSCSFTISVADMESPTLSCPADLIVAEDPPGSGASVVTYNSPIADDNCPGVGSAGCSPASGSLFPLGITTVECAVEDAAFNGTTCSFQVTVRSQPVLVAAGAVVSMESCSPPNGAIDPGETVTVRFCVRNTGKTDTTHLVGTLLSTGGIVPIGSPQAFDVVPAGGAEVCRELSFRAPDQVCGSEFTASVQFRDGIFDLGILTYDFTVGPGAGSARCCSPVPPCALGCPESVVRKSESGRCGVVVRYAPPSAEGSCNMVICSPASGSLFPRGTTTVSCVESPGGEICTFTVTVLDAEPPSLRCPDTIKTSPSSGCAAAVNYLAPAITDRCPGATFTCVPPSGSTFPIGSTTVRCTAIDASGNQADCSFPIIVSNAMPMANAGPDRFGSERVPIPLMGAGTDADPGQVLTFAWSQKTGPPGGFLTGVASPAAEFTPPDVSLLSCRTFSFELRVTDSCGGMATDLVEVKVGDRFVMSDDENGNCVVLTMNCRTGGGYYCWSSAGGERFSGLCRVTLSSRGTANFRSLEGDVNLFEGGVDLIRRRGNARITIRRPASGRP
ncbi:MAG: HYR domain-containing protein, partial [Acidobacteria bacterium]|nr:HYR domain-containing protein [Acidobacteriota bacterium]